MVTAKSAKLKSLRKFPGLQYPETFPFSDKHISIIIQIFDTCIVNFCHRKESIVILIVWVPRTDTGPWIPLPWQSHWPPFMPLIYSVHVPEGNLSSEIAFYYTDIVNFCHNHTDLKKERALSLSLCGYHAQTLAVGNPAAWQRVTIANSCLHH